MSENIQRIIAELYPHLSEEERLEMEQRLRRYLAMVKRIYDHVGRHDPKVLTRLRKRANVWKKAKKGA